MLFTSDGRRCNFLTAWWYRRQILRNYVWGKQCGFTNYVVDPYTPFGLLAAQLPSDPGNPAGTAFPGA